jgi:hypothetical protein
LTQALDREIISKQTVGNREVVLVPIQVDEKAKSLLRAIPYFRKLDDRGLEAVAREVIARHFWKGTPRMQAYIWWLREWRKFIACPRGGGSIF